MDRAERVWMFKWLTPLYTVLALTTWWAWLRRGEWEWLAMAIVITLVAAFGWWLLWWARRRD
ncbi:DUF4175 domain-containing protein [Cellulomonas rhizosphaerae]|uniref:DUF4175 domain-containing protein n=1 Tax=Cellulomonas rhizosphaerae TaxID=2293719 RepID=UPI0010FD1DCC|nr:DUF4175 domain-containing protein [Cellulomonas rhizosphaerae]